MKIIKKKKILNRQFYLLVHSAENVLFNVFTMKEKWLNYTDRFSDKWPKTSPENSFTFWSDWDKSFFCLRRPRSPFSAATSGQRMDQFEAGWWWKDLLDRDWNHVTVIHEANNGCVAIWGGNTGAIVTAERRMFHDVNVSNNGACYSQWGRLHVLDKRFIHFVDQVFIRFQLDPKFSWGYWVGNVDVVFLIQHLNGRVHQVGYSWTGDSFLDMRRRFWNIDFLNTKKGNNC